MISPFTLSNIFLGFGIPSGPDLFILLIIVLVLFGAKRLPEIARSLGQSVNEFKKAKDEFEKEVSMPTPPASPVNQAAINESSAAVTTDPAQK
ncbi:MAG: twin-arginine translocase TatA/TatE family subunit [Chthoniobacterales bacterium]